MTAPLYLLDGHDRGLAPGGVLVLDGAEGRHAGTVRRTRVGERVDVADGLGTLAHCLVAHLAPARVELSVESVEQVPEPASRLVLVQALAKGGRDELAVETATELGVDEVVPWQAARSVVLWSGERGRRAHAKWGSVLRAAAKQSRRARLPHLAAPLTSAQLSARVADVVAGGGIVLVLHEDAEAPLPVRQELTGAGEVLVVVGPEGGIDEAELRSLTIAGGHAVRLGPHVLRTSTAGTAALVALSVATGRWS